MPRRSSRARGPLRNPLQRAAPAPAPAPAPSPPPAPAPVQRGSATGGLGSVVAEGMAFGGGNAIAHRAVDAVVGPRVIRHEAVASSAPSAAPVPTNSDACVSQSKALIDCLNHYTSDISKCQFYMDMLSECRKGSVSGLSG